jgi:DNA modification methylase
MTVYYADESVTLHLGDCIDVMRGLDAESVDSICTDPPYNLSFMAKPWDAFTGQESAGFCYWLAGLIDGEGHFAIKAHTRGTHAPAFALKLRADERGTLETIRRATGIGSITDEARDPNPMVKWTVQSREDCQRLCDLLDKYPLRAKKLADYWVWREAVCDWTTRPRGNRWAGAADNSRMAELRDRLMTGRAYSQIPWSGNEFQDWCRLWATEALRVLRPGGHLLAFGGTRTWHRLAVAVEDAGFEIRDSIAWLYGQGFPKSMNPGCACPVDSRGEPDPKGQHDLRAVRAGHVPEAEGTSRGSGQVLLAPVPESGAPTTGWPQLSTAEDGRGEPGVEGWRDHAAQERQLPANTDGAVPTGPLGNDAREWSGAAASAGHGEVDRASADSGGVRQPHRPRHDEQRPQQPRTVADEPGPQAGRGRPVCERCGKPQVVGLGTALKPAFEPVVVARKALAGTVAQNVQAHGVGALNIDACRIDSGDREATTYEVNRLKPGATLNREGGTWRNDSDDAPRYQGSTPAGRWPANVALDESQAAALDQQSGYQKDGVAVNRNRVTGAEKNGWIAHNPSKVGRPDTTYGSGGGASRFMYVAKAPKSERPVVDGIAHPTVKPLALMRWLCRLVTPPGGLILEPFAGSGTTVEAAVLEGFSCVAIEREATYLSLIEARLARAERLDFPALFGCEPGFTGGTDRNAFLQELRGHEESA